MTGESFGSKVKAARKEQGMSQRELAQRVQIDYGYLSKIESGKIQPPSESVIIKIAAELGLDPDQLLYLADRAPSDLDEIITEAPYIPAILRRAKGLTREDWKEVEELIKSKKGGKE